MYEIFNRGRHISPRGGGAFVSVAKGTRLVFSKACIPLFGDFERVEYWLDVEKKMVGIKPTEKISGYVLHKGASQYYCSARNLIKLLGIPDAHRIEVSVENCMLVFSYAKNAELVGLASLDAEINGAK